MSADLRRRYAEALRSVAAVRSEALVDRLAVADHPPPPESGTDSGGIGVFARVRPTRHGREQTGGRHRHDRHRGP